VCTFAESSSMPCARNMSSAAAAPCSIACICLVPRCEHRDLPKICQRHTSCPAHTTDTCVCRHFKQLDHESDKALSVQFDDALRAGKRTKSKEEASRKPKVRDLQAEVQQMPPALQPSANAAALKATAAAAGAVGGSAATAQRDGSVDAAAAAAAAQQQQQQGGSARNRWLPWNWFRGA
jgi:hypothetical protein